MGKHRRREREREGERLKRRQDKQRNEQLDRSRKLKLTAVNNGSSCHAPVHSRAELQSRSPLQPSWSSIFFMRRHKSHVDCLFSCRVHYSGQGFADNNWLIMRLCAVPGLRVIPPTRSQSRSQSGQWQIPRNRLMLTLLRFDAPTTDNYGELSTWQQQQQQQERQQLTTQSDHNKKRNNEAHCKKSTTACTTTSTPLLQCGCVGGALTIPWSGVSC